jgi:hypothetical protein
VLPGVVMPFTAADEGGRDTLVCKSSSRASSNKRMNHCIVAMSVSYKAVHAEINDDGFVISLLVFRVGFSGSRKATLYRNTVVLFSKSCCLFVGWFNDI